MKKRIDRLLLEKELVSSRSLASDLIKEGVVFANGELVSKASFKVDENSHLEIKKDQIYVGRGAHKIEGAHKAFNLNFKDKVIGDMGASTGGFTEYALLAGAKKIYAVDVGVDQLALKLREDPRVLNLEGTNIRDGLSFFDCDLIVTDLSFISLDKVVAPMASTLRDKGEFVFLVKPQFEVGKEGLGKNGVVRDTGKILESVLGVIRSCIDVDLIVKDCHPCPLKGRMGNQEFFIYGVKDKEAIPASSEKIEQVVKAAL